MNNKTDKKSIITKTSSSPKSINSSELVNRPEFISTPQQNNAAEANQADLFCYIIGNTRILIEQGIKMELLEKNTIYPIPNMPKWYSGITSLRGETLVVVNLHYLLGLPENNASLRLLKLEHPDFPPLTIAIDNLPYQMKAGDLSANQKPADKQYPDWIKSSSILNNYTFLFVDHSALFNTLQESSI